MELKIHFLAVAVCTDKALYCGVTSLIILLICTTVEGSVIHFPV